MNKGKHHYIVSAIMALTIAIIVGLAAVNGVFRNVESMMQDGLYQKPGIIPNHIKIIKIDEKTFSRLGPYTAWDRSYFADLIEILNADEKKAPAIIGMDIVFSGSNQTEADKRLVESAKKCDNLVLATSITVDSYIYKDEEGDYYRDRYISHEARPFEELDAVAMHGFTNAIFDEDGFVRRTYTSIVSEYNGEKSVYDSFAYVIASQYGEVKDYDARVEIAFTGKPGEFEAISMVDVLDGTIPASYFKDCIVLVGAYEEGMMDAYRVPIDYAQEMYGVELQANYINAFLNDSIIYDVNETLQFFMISMIVALYAYLAFNTGMRDSIIGLFGSILVYELTAVAVYGFTSYKMNLLAVPIGVLISFIVSFMYRHYEMQRLRVLEMRNMLFSMAEAMAEAIEGRTPYNANHTKNVAKRCIEMLEYINQKHREKKTDLHFTKADKQQLYLAAMLHDVGKMDVPLEVMDKPTKLGNREKQLRDRLEIITLRLQNDVLNGCMEKEAAEQKMERIRMFSDSLGAFNCGRPLKEEEWELVNEIADSRYIDQDGNELPYLTQEEIDDLHIKAGTLSEQERNIMQSHVVYTDKILSHMDFGEQFKDVRAMASNHHELLNGRGYPNGIGEDEIDVMTRILTIMDIYDSLIADDRPYKKPKPVKIAFDILDEEAEAGKVDKELLQFAKELYLKEEKE